MALPQVSKGHNLTAWVANPLTTRVAPGKVPLFLGSPFPVVTKSSSHDSCVPWTLDGILFIGNPLGSPKSASLPQSGELALISTCTFRSGSWEGILKYIELGGAREEDRAPRIPCSVAPPSVPKLQGLEVLLGIPPNNPINPTPCYHFLSWAGEI